MKCFAHHWLSNLCCFVLRKTLRRVKWSLSGTKNFSLAASLSSSLSLGLKNTLGTESIATIVRTSSLQFPFSCANRSILERGGSRGNSDMFVPIFVRLPVLSNAPSTHNWYKLDSSVAWGGGDMKSKSSKFSTPRLFRSKTTFERFVLCISGTLLAISSSLYCLSVYRRNAKPGPVLPALPLLWFAFACDTGVTLRVSIPIFEL
mmetsp:Transcript_4639/g.9329  ORF Transcript_4639/g.9329 Transcript_4639/m.9329 type:complete len:204 (-) Transcript_4639:1138-1749(-)